MLPTLKKAASSLGHRIKLLLRGFSILHRMEPRFLPLAALLGLVKPLAPYVGLYASARILNELLGQRRISVLTELVLVCIGLSFLLHILSGWLESRHDVMSFHGSHHLYQLTGKRCCDMDYDQLNNPEIRAMLASIQESWRINGGGLPMLFYQAAPFFEGFFGLILSVLLLGGIATPAAFHSSWLTSSWLNAAVMLLMLALIFALIALQRKAMGDYTRQIAKMANPRAFLEHIARYVDVNRAGKDIRVYDQTASIGEMMQETLYASGALLKTIHKLNNSQAARVAGERLLTGVLYAVLGLRALAGMYEAGNVMQYAGALLGLFNYIGVATNAATYL